MGAAQAIQAAADFSPGCGKIKPLLITGLLGVLLDKGLLHFLAISDKPLKFCDPGKRGVQGLLLRRGKPLLEVFGLLTQAQDRTLKRLKQILRGLSFWGLLCL
jgi:hypothetical protein